MFGVALDAAYGSIDGAFHGGFFYTKGLHTSMHRSRLWMMRLFTGFATVLDTNARLKKINAAGGAGVVDRVAHAKVAGPGL